MRLVSCLLIALAAPVVTVQAQPRDLYWSQIEVIARLAADGTLHVDERQTMVFTGDWNGGERTFNVRPRQSFRFKELSRLDGEVWRPLRHDPALDQRDEYGWSAPHLLRWRSREPQDAVFSRSSLQYRLEYELANILLKDGDEYVLDHDFLFPDRGGRVERFTLRLALDAAWDAASPLREVYQARDVSPRRGYILTIPLRYRGAGVPLYWDQSRPPLIVTAVVALLAVSALLVVGLLRWESANGRFAPYAPHVDEAFLREHVLKYPAEVVGAIWDEQVGAAELVALLARLEAEGKLESTVLPGDGMDLRLKADREKIDGYERTLVDALFFDGRTSVTTADVQQHYRDKGFNPVRLIKRGIEREVEQLVPTVAPIGGLLLFVVIFGVATVGVLMSPLSWAPTIGIGVGALVLAIAGVILGGIFHDNSQLGRRHALFALIPAAATVAGVSAFLWFWVGPGTVEVSPSLIVALVAIAVGIVYVTVGAMRSRRGRDAMGFRRNLAAARAFFEAELAKTQSALRDEWLPWILAFGLQPPSAEWFVASPSRIPDWNPEDPKQDRFDDVLEPVRWNAFAGGRSGGAGGGASWAVAANSLAHGVSAPSRSASAGARSDSSSDSWSSGGDGGGGDSGSSSGGSSGGGGGGGW